jgi:hypothetical protein
MIIYIIRRHDLNAHEGDDGIYDILRDENRANKLLNELNANPYYKRMGINNFTYYIEEWEVE